MSEETTVKDDVIRKMLRPPPVARGRLHDILLGIGPDLFRRAAKSAHDLNLTVQQVSATVTPAAEALSALPDKRMVAVLSHQTEPLGLMVFDATMLDALIEQQTLGEVLKSPRLDRPVTDIDRSMSEPFQREILAQLSMLISGAGPARSLDGYKVLRMETDPVRLSLDLTASAYEILRVDLDLGPGQKTGHAQLWLPAADMPRAAKKTPAKMNPALLELAADVEVPLTVTLPAIKLSVKKLMALEPGAKVSVDPRILREADVIDICGKALTKAHLGQLNGVRAVRLRHLGPSVPASPQPDAPQFDPSALADLSDPVTDGDPPEEHTGASSSADDTLQTN